ncbi:MAG: hypothetical protein GF307_10810 [candidate division Zixibacteria bacterium]|nr:hypothetical protein [candidate division Zixibacteria bacterium]
MRAILLLIVLTGLNETTSAGITLTEVLANEPGRTSSLEWIEVYNSGPENLNLEDCVFMEDNSKSKFPEGSVIKPGQYAIFARRPLGGNPDEPSFEKQWGNGTGKWGDSPLEKYALYPLKMSLRNSSGRIAIACGGDIISSFSWNDDPGDGISFEKIYISNGDVLSNWMVSSAAAGSTPGGPPVHVSGSIRPDFPGASNVTNGAVNSITINPEIVFLQFESDIKINWILEDDSELNMLLYNLQGEVVKDFEEELKPGEEEICYNCTDDAGNLLSSGIYVLLGDITGGRDTIIKRQLIVINNPRH